jgi:predicted phosphodiesterase
MLRGVEAAVHLGDGTTHFSNPVLRFAG